MKQELEIKTRRTVLRGHKSGQAVVEYILIVSIAVALIFIMKGAFKGMSDFIDNYLGSYTTCLMAHGELPTLGIGNETLHDGSNLKEHLSSGYTCNAGFKPFTLAEGRPPIANGDNSGNGSRNASGKGGSGSETGSGGSGSDSGRNSSDKNRDRDGSEANGGSGGSGGKNPYDDGRIRRGGRSTADGIASGNSNTRLIDEEEGDEVGGSSRKRRPRESRIIYRDRQRYRAVLGNEAEQIVNQTQRSSIKRKPTSRSIAKVENGNFNGPRSGLMRPPPEKKPAVVEERDSGWGFGKFLKWLLIIAIIIAVIILFGGQLLNYSNSDS